MSEPDRRTVLIVEDEPKLAQVLVEYLDAEGYEARVLRGGLEVVPWVRRHTPDLILLDIMLPGRTGFDVCQDVRSFSTVPVIMLTARIEEVDRLLGLECGADDYVCKPYSPREVMARVKALFRRSDMKLPALAAEQGVCLDEKRWAARIGGQTVDLTATEYRLLKILLTNPGRVLSRDRLLDCLNEEGRGAADRTVDSHIKNLRRKLALIAPDRELIYSVYGVGYRFDY